MVHLMFQKSPDHSCFSITFLTILFHPEATMCTFFVPCVYFAFFFFSLPHGLQLDATDLFHDICVSQFIDVNV